MVLAVHRTATGSELWTGVGVPARTGAATVPRGVRLTARGRRVVAAVVLLALVGLGVIAASLTTSPGGGGLELAGEESVVVEPGDTVWEIARTIAGDTDVRAVVDAIHDLNDLDGGAILPGQVLRLP